MAYRKARKRTTAISPSHPSSSSRPAGNHLSQLKDMSKPPAQTVSNRMTSATWLSKWLTVKKSVLPYHYVQRRHHYRNAADGTVVLQGFLSDNGTWSLHQYVSGIHNVGSNNLTIDFVATDNDGDRTTHDTVIPATPDIAHVEVNEHGLDNVADTLGRSRHGKQPERFAHRRNRTRYSCRSGWQRSSDRRRRQ